MPELVLPDFLREKYKRKHSFAESVVDRFYGSFARDSSGCWLWSKSLKVGYGQLSVAAKPNFAHRLSWQIHKGQIPKDKMVLHKCNNRKCVNPDHLYLGTAKQNVADMARSGKARFGAPRLSWDDVVFIRQNYRKIRTNDLCERFKICRSMLSQIVRFKRRKMNYAF